VEGGPEVDESVTIPTPIATMMITARTAITMSEIARFPLRVGFRLIESRKKERLFITRQLLFLELGRHPSKITTQFVFPERKGCE
jgi:hypothetical protein